MATDDRKEEKERRKRAREAIRSLLRRVKEVRRTVKTVDTAADLIDDVVGQVRSFVEGPDARILPEGVRRRLSEAAERFERAKERLDTITDACEQLTEALEAAEEFLPRAGAGALTVAAVAGIVIAVGLGIVVALILPDDGGDGPPAPPPSPTESPDDLPPDVEITSPANGSSWSAEAFDDEMMHYKEVTLVGEANDPEGGPVTVVWTTSTNGGPEQPLGTGATLTARLYAPECDDNTHDITATATDREENAGTDSITVTVRKTCIE